MNTIISWYDYQCAPKTADEPWVMSLILRAEKDHEMFEEEILETTALGVATFFDDPRSLGDWKNAIDSWLSSNIRKVARTARGAKWDRVQDLPGINIVHKGVHMRVLVPVPVSNIPKEVHRLQVAGLNYDARGQFSDDAGLHVAFNKNVNMTTGKKMAQMGHLVQYALMGGISLTEMHMWKAMGFPVSFMPWGSIPADLVVKDAGYTEVAPGTITAQGYFCTTHYKSTHDAHYSDNQ